MKSGYEMRNSRTGCQNKITKQDVVKYAALSFNLKQDSVEAIIRHGRTESHISKVRANLRGSAVGWYSVLHHVPTSFLSVLAAMDRLLKNWTVIKSYFSRQGKEKVS